MGVCLRWIPPVGKGIRLVPCGRWWDAVQVPRSRQRDLAGEVPGGGVLEDQSEDVLTWLLPVGTAPAGWGRGGVRVLGRGYHLPVPPGEWRTGWWLTWRTAPRGDGLTDPDALRALLAELPERCDRCHRLAAPPATITGPAPGGGTVTVITCQGCADTMTAVLRATASLAADRLGRAGQ
ncbi:hypothetical protein ACFV0Z_09795 [Streptomyces xiamenensis]|uniref:hypothetical protein n=1 Tax=Streptomyces xiamenensis TaxID=408015 RepID=UPI00369A471B